MRPSIRAMLASARPHEAGAARRRRRADAALPRRAHAEPRDSPRAARRADDDGAAGGDVQRAGDDAHGPACPRAHGAVGNGWFARDTARSRSGASRTRSSTGEKLYETRAQRDPLVHLRQALLVVEPRRAPSTGRSRRGRSTRPTGARSRRSYAWPTRVRRASSSARSARSRSSTSGDRSPGCRRAAGSRTRRSRTLAEQRPTLTLVYLPHLDYDFQRFGPDDPRSQQRRRGDRRASSATCCAAAERAGAEIVVVSEYGIDAVDPPVHVNRALREAGLLVARATPAGEVLDAFGEPRVRGRRPPGRARLRAGRARRARRARARARRAPRRRARARRRRATRARASTTRAPATSSRRAAERLVHLLLLARRRARARLRAHGRHPPQARLRPVRAVPRSRRSRSRSCASRGGSRRRSSGCAT